MRPRAAIFCLHDVVPPERLAEVSPTHRRTKSTQCSTFAAMLSLVSGTCNG